MRSYSCPISTASLFVLVVVYFRDVPGHEPACVSFGALNREKVVSALNMNDISVIVVSLDIRVFDNAPRSTIKCSVLPAGPGQACFITSMTKKNLQSSVSTAIVDKIKDGTTVSTSTFTAAVSDCKGILLTSFDPNLPLIPSPGMSKIVIQTLGISRSLCSGLSSPFMYQVKYQESGVGLDLTTLAVKTVSGC